MRSSHACDDNFIGNEFSILNGYFYFERTDFYGKEKRKRQNHKNDTIKYKLRSELHKMESYGRSKKADMQKTKADREKLRAGGATYSESLRINHSKEHIYSYSTMENYQKEVGRFGDWLIKQGHKRISIEDSKAYIQPYIDYCVEQKLSPYTINKRLSAICKATHADIQDYSHPERSIAKIERGVAPAVHDEYNEKHYAEIISANRILGLRRNELKRLKVEDFEITDKYIIVHTVGKGGKENVQIITDKAEIETAKSWLVGKNPEDRVFSTDNFNNDVNFHKQRELRAKDVYERVVADMQNNPESREYYKIFIKKFFERSGKKMREDLEKSYVVRGENRTRLEQQGRALEYDRVAVLYVSLTVLNHYRSDTSVNHYIAK